MGGEGRYSQCGGSSRSPRPVGGSQAPPRTPGGARDTAYGKRRKKAWELPAAVPHPGVWDVSWHRQVPLPAAVPWADVGDLPCQPETQESEGKTNYPQQLWERGRREDFRYGKFSSCVKEGEGGYFNNPEFLAGADNWKNKRDSQLS